jgi:ABC-2 type transport system ATP-binding protein
MIIHTEGLNKYYGNLKALDAVSIDVKGGEIFGFFGPNGAGKTTMIRVLTGLTQSDGGSAYVAGIDVTSHPNMIRKYISILVEIPFLYENMTCREYLTFFGKMSQVPQSELKSNVGDLIELMELTQKQNVKILKLSSGMRQRLELARVLLSDARILFLDEPFNMIDIELRKRIRNLLRKWLGKDRAIFFTSHNLIESEYIVDRFAFIANGRIVTAGAAKDLKRKFLLPSFTVEVSHPQKAAAVLRATRGVSEVNIGDGCLNVTLMGREYVGMIPKAMVNNNIELYEMKAAGTMEDVFDRVITCR